LAAISRVVLTSREHIIGLESLDKGLMGTRLRYPYEVREGKTTEKKAVKAERTTKRKAG
jgi:non-homologous end joining protein Ku